jgi:DNA-binding protein Fis
VVSAEGLRRLVAPEPMEAAINDSLQSLAGRLLQLPVRNKLAAVEEALLATALEACEGNKSAAARMLGLHRKAVERKLEKYDVRHPLHALPGPKAVTGMGPVAMNGHVVPEPGTRAVPPGPFPG